MTSEKTQIDSIMDQIEVLIQQAMELNVHPMRIDLAVRRWKHLLNQ